MTPTRKIQIEEELLHYQSDAYRRMVIELLLAILEALTEKGM